MQPEPCIQAICQNNFGFSLNMEQSPKPHAQKSMTSFNIICQLMSTAMWQRAPQRLMVAAWIRQRLAYTPRSAKQTCYNQLVSSFRSNWPEPDLDAQLLVEPANRSGSTGTMILTPIILYTVIGFILIYIYI